MPITPTAPGVYPVVVPSQTHAVISAPTSNAAVIDWFPQGPVNQAIQVNSLNQFNTTFGGVSEGSEGSYAVQQFFLNGGSLIWVVRVVPGGAQAAYVQLPVTSPPNTDYYILAANPGSWGNFIAISLNQQPNTSPSGSPLYTLSVGQSTQATSGSNPPYQTVVVETYYGVSLNPLDPSFAPNVINSVSQYITVQSSLTFLPNDENTLSPPNSPPFTVGSSPPPAGGWYFLTNGEDGAWSASDGSDFTAALTAQVTVGTAALDLIAPQVFNILLIPAAALLPGQETIVEAAILYCQTYLAFFLLDPPPPSLVLSNPVQTQPYPWGIGTTVSTDAQLQTFANSYINENNGTAALYYPWLVIQDPANNYQPRYVAPSGTVAGLYAANDANYGVWKAPAGVNAVLQGVTSLAAVLTDNDSSLLNPQGINALRSFPIYGNLVWGARTLAGADLLQSQFKYINVQRLTYFIEQSLTQSLKWAVFEPNGPVLWSSITLEVTSFMAGLFSQGAFQGTTASQAYFVQCDNTTTTPQDMLNGVVNVIVGFSPVFPAEFIILQIELQLLQPSSS